MREGRREVESGEDEGLGSEIRLDRPRSAKGHRRRVEMGERGGEGKGGENKTSDDPVPEPTLTSQQSPSPPPISTHPQPPSPPVGLV